MEEEQRGKSLRREAMEEEVGSGYELKMIKKHFQVFRVFVCETVN